ncbi:MAG TPA: MmcQ/YjbR family DNA-binding protein [Acidobacteriota bacterium]|nr:MmcQ/YjbR family DNA-binding protein [Acidobacteriota bacterium]
MDFESIRKVCLSFPGATEDIQWEKDLLFRVGGKMFAVVGLEPEPENVAFKCTPEEFAELTLRDGIIPAPYLARHHWVLANFDVLRKAELERLLQSSYQIVLEGLPKKIRESVDDAKNKTSAKRMSAVQVKKARGK